MKDYRSRLLIGLCGVACTFCFLAWFLAVQLRTRYGNQLIQEIWPTALVRAPVTTGQPQSEGNVLLFGDSRISEWEGVMLSGQTVVNAGQPGATTARLQLQLSGLLDEFHPGTVVIQAGVNDLKLIGLKPELKLLIVAQALNNISNMVAQCYTHNCRVVLLGVWPVGKPELLRRPVWNQEIASAVTGLNERLSELDDPSKKVFFCDIFKSSGLTKNQLLFRDALHFQPAVYRQLTVALQEKFNAISAETLK